MKQTICDICGKAKTGDEKENIEGNLRFCTYDYSKDGCTNVMSCECRDIYLCSSCSKRMMKCAKAIKEHKRIRIGRKNED